MILYIFQSYLQHYKYYRCGSFIHKITVVPLMSMWCMLSICTETEKKSNIEFATVVTWIYTEPKNQNNATRKNFQSSNFSTFHHHLKVNFHLFHWLNLLAQILLWGSHAPANMAALDYKATDNSTCYESTKIMGKQIRILRIFHWEEVTPEGQGMPLQ